MGNGRNRRYLAGCLSLEISADDVEDCPGGPDREALQLWLTGVFPLWCVRCRTGDLRYYGAVRNPGE